MAGTLQDRAISVPSIVSHYTDEQLNSEYHNKADYQQAINKYGAIYKLIDFNDLKNKDEIKQAAIDWIKDHYFDGVSVFTVKAVDLHLLGFDKDKIRVGDRVTVEFIDIADTPITKTLTCLSEQIDILNPQNSTYKIGIPDTSLSLKRRWPGNGKGGSVSGKSSSGGGGGGGGNSTLYKYYTEQLKDSRETAQIHADDIYLIGQQISSVVGATKDLTWRVDTIDGSAVIQNSTEIIDVVGNFRIKSNYYGDWAPWNSTTPQAYRIGDKVTVEGRGFVCIKNCPADVFIPISNTEYWREDTGRKGVELIDGAAFELSDSDGGLLSVGQRINDLDAKTAEFEGSALWTQRDNITGVVGEYDIEVDQVTGRKTLIVKSGGGMKIRRDNVEYGLYDEGSLTAGVVIEKVNRTVVGTWQQYVYYPVGAKVTHDGTSYICKTAHRSGSTFDSSKWEVYSAISTKITGEIIDIKATDLATWGVYTDDTLTGGIIAQKVNSAQNAKINFSQLNTSVTDYTAMGLFSDTTLTGGILVQKLNDGTVTTSISGDIIDITAQQVRVGSTSNVEAWMTSTGTTLDTYYGLITDRATIGQLNAQKARIDDIEADYITADNLYASIASLNSVNVQSITSSRGGASFYSLSVTGVPTFGGVDCNVPRAVNNITLTPNGNNTYTLTATTFSGATIDIGTFERGAGGTPSSYQLNYQSAPYTYHARVGLTEGGVTTWYESGDLYATQAYDNGWTGAYGTVEAYRVYTGSAGSTVALDYGESALIAARAKSTSGAQSKTAVDIIEVTAPEVVDVVRGTWDTSGTRARMTLTPSAGTGASADIAISLALVKTDDLTGDLWTRDYGSGSQENLKKYAYALSQDDNWSSNKKNVTFTIGSADVATMEVDASSIYTSGASSVTVTAAGWVGGSNVVTASNGNSVTVNLPPISLTGGTTFSSHKTTVYASGGGASGYVASKQVDATSEYEAGQTAAGLAIGTGNKVVRALSSSTKEYEIKAVASISYNSSTHKYTASAQSQAGSTNMGSDSKTGGTEAYDDGASSVTLSGAWSSRTFTVTASNGETYSETVSYTKGTGYGSVDSITVDSFSSSHFACARVLRSSAQGGNVICGFKIDASGEYESGWIDGYNAAADVFKVTGSSTGKITFPITTDTYGTSASDQYDITADVTNPAQGYYMGIAYINYVQRATRSRNFS